MSNIAFITTVSLDNSEHIRISELVKNLIKGQRSSFDMLFHLFSNRIYKLARKLRLDHEEAEEVIQEVFLTIWDRRSFLDPDKDFKAYIFKIAKSHIIKNFKKKALFYAYENYVKDTKAIEDFSTEQLINYQNLLEILEMEIKKLPPAKQEIFKLSRQEGLSVDEIAEKLNLSKRTVENQIYRTLKLLKDGIQSKDAFLIMWLYLFI